MMRKTLAVISIGATAFAFATSAMAATLNAQPGEWKVSVTTVRNGEPGEPRTNSTCITKDQLENLSSRLAAPRKSQTENCQRISFDQKETTVDWKYQCTGDFTINTMGSIKFDSPTHYTGTMKTSSTIRGQTVDSVTKMDATRVGECTGKEGAPAAH